MHKRDVMIFLEALVVERLFGSSPWPPDPPTCEALSTTLFRLGLEEHEPGQHGTFRATALGKELQVDLVSSFIGLMEECSALHVLGEHGLMRMDEINLFYEMLGDDLLGSEKDIAQMLRRRFQEAYFQYQNPSKLKN